MSVIPTTRNGYLFGARRRKIPWESEGPDYGRKFQRGRGPAPRMAGDVRLGTSRPGQMDAPYGVGRGFTPEDSNAWDVEDGPDAWQTFDENLEPQEQRGKVPNW